MIAWKANLPLDDPGFWVESPAFCKADDAAFTAVGLYAVLDSKQLIEERLCHCLVLVCWLLDVWF